MIAAARLLQSIEDDLARSTSVKLTVTVIREHPQFRAWQRGYPTRDTAHDLIVKQWQDAVVKVNGRYPKHPRKFFPELADAARSWLEDEDMALAGVWATITALPGWSAAPRSARELYRLLHAEAAEPGVLGGRRVLMCHALAIALIECPAHKTLLRSQAR